MPGPDEGLVAEAERFSDDIADLLGATICGDASAVSAEVSGDRVVVAPHNARGEETGLPLRIAGRERLDLRFRYRCTWDFTGQFLAVGESQFAIALPQVREPLVRVDYQRSRRYAPAHLQVHAESSALGYLLAWAEETRAPKVQLLHLPVGGKRFRPCMEDVVEFVVEDLGVETTSTEWRVRVESGRQEWKRTQLKAAMRDVLRADPERLVAELREAVEDAYRDVAGDGR